MYCRHPSATIRLPATGDAPATGASGHGLAPAHVDGSASAPIRTIVAPAAVRYCSAAVFIAAMVSLSPGHTDPGAGSGDGTAGAWNASYHAESTQPIRLPLS